MLISSPIQSYSKNPELRLLLTSAFNQGIINGLANVGQVDILAIPSYNNLNDVFIKFLQQISSKYLLISAGYKYFHLLSDSAIMPYLKRQNIKIYATPTDGMIVFKLESAGETEEPMTYKNYYLHFWDA